MMKNITMAFMMLLTVPATVWAQNTIEIEGEVSDVTVFLKGAQVTRTAKASLKSGENILKFTGLTSNLDANSIQVSAKGDFMIMGVKHQINYLKDQKLSPKIEVKKDSLKDLQLKIQMRRSLKSVYQEEKGMILANKVIKGQDSNLLAEDLLEMADFYRTRLKEIEFRLIELSQEEQELQETINRLNNDLAGLNSRWNRNSSEIEVRVKSNKVQDGNFDISYQVYNAGWVPNYDIRANDITGPVDLIYKAKVYQSTGYDWDRVNLTISTGNPTAGGQPPVLNPWYLQMYDPEVYSNNNSNNKQRMNAYSGVAQEADMMFKADDAETLGGSVAQQEGLVNTEFKIGIPYTVPSDNKQYDVELLRPSLKADYRYFSAPRSDKDAFLLARVTDWAQYNLMPGESNIYYQGTFVGKAFIDPAINQDTLQLSLGRDKSVVLRREQIKDFCKTSVFGSKKSTSKGYSIKVTNNKSKPITIQVKDQVPLSNMGELIVEIDELSGGVHDPLSGFVDWELNLRPGETRELILKYTVKYPKKKILSNL